MLGYENTIHTPFIHEIILLIHIYLVFRCYPSSSLAHRVQVFTHLFHKPMPCQSPKRKKKGEHSHLNMIFNLFPPHSLLFGSFCKFECVLVYVMFTKYHNYNRVVVVGLGFPTTL